MIRPVYDADLCASVAASMNLRKPNADALTTIAVRAAQRFEDPSATLFEGVVDVATGVGKTFILVAAIDYFTALGYRNFAIITPGQTITRKTIANFTPGHPKSLLDGIETAPFVVTADSFETPAVASALDDATLAKVYIFTVQSLLTPSSKSDRKTHVFDEDLGAAFYDRLRDLDDLIIFADESHVYTGKKFDAAVRGLEPQMLIGLTATPDKDAPVIFRYPLAAAIAEGFVKTPVIAGRVDDRDDYWTKLNDGVRLLDAKATLVDKYLAEHPDLPVVHPVMLVIAPDTDSADECVGILKHPTFEEGRYAKAILNIHSKVDDADKALADLDAVEDPDSKVRVIVSVGMLKEGWDVKNVYVILSLRALVSQILTEQTLGRGLRLPFGSRTGEEMLDTLEVVAHERYDQVISNVNRLREQFIDYRTVIIPKGGQAADVEQRDAPLAFAKAANGAAVSGEATVANIEDRLAHADAAIAEASGPELRPRADLPVLMLPVVAAMPIEQAFSLSQIIDLDPFRREGRRIATNPDDRLRRTLIEAEITVDAAGERQAVVRGRKAADLIEAGGQSVTVAESIRRLTSDVMASGCVPNRKGEPALLRWIIDAVVDGLGAQAQTALAAYEQRAAEGIITLIRAAQANHVPIATFSDDVEEIAFTAMRRGRPTVLDKGHPFTRRVGYSGFQKSLYAQDWFDSGTAEFALAKIIDDAGGVAYWLRLQRDDLPLPWQGSARSYNPDFIVVEKDGVHWVVEAKADDTAKDTKVIAKRDAAMRWANHVTAITGVQWRYVFMTESDIATSKGDWPALKRLALAD